MDVQSHEEAGQEYEPGVIAPAFLNSLDSSGCWSCVYCCTELSPGDEGISMDEAGLCYLAAARLCMPLSGDPRE
jgi:hypothetical protein